MWIVHGGQLQNRVICECHIILPRWPDLLLLVLLLLPRWLAILYTTTTVSICKYVCVIYRFADVKHIGFNIWNWIPLWLIITFQSCITSSAEWNYDSLLDISTKFGFGHNIICKMATMNSIQKCKNCWPETQFTIQILPTTTTPIIRKGEK